MARTVKCPSCGAELTIKDESRDFMFCEYCGTKVRLDDYQETHRFVDEAKVRRVDAFKDITMKGMELHEKKQEQEREEAEKNRRMMPVYIGLMIAIPVIAGIILKFFG
jgi:acetyl-CoA carboxylase beta subunit